MSPTPPRTLDELVLAAQPGIDPLAASVSQALVASALFGTGATPQVGRFRLIDRLGAGVAGVVFRAYDPQLDRAVALKLVRISAKGRDAALAEARALARLSHPNVVPVHEIGLLDEHVFIVMELVRGPALHAWLRSAPRQPADVLRMFSLAGAGLAAAHAAGLVHRDFKPANVVVGADGRPRVVDFGLALEQTEGTAGRPGGAAGTPPYTAPELATGAAPSVAADQYSFCVALREALGPPEAVPRWLQAVLRRGLASAPAERFASMTDLLRALASDPARAWRSRAAIAVVGLAVAGSFIGGRALSRRQPQCDGARASLTALWQPRGREATLLRIAALGEFGADSAARLAEQVTAYEARWAQSHAAACVAHRDGHLTDARFDRHTGCLGRGRSALTALAETTRSATAASLPQLIEAASALPDFDGCSERAPEGEPPPRDEQRAAVREVEARLAYAEVLLAAGRLTDARLEVEQQVERARATGHPPVLAEALYLSGKLWERLDRAKAFAPLDEAMTLALSNGQTRTAVLAWALRASVRATTTGPDHAIDGLDVMEPLANREPRPSMVRTWFYMQLARVARAQSDFGLARRYYARALEDGEGVAGPDAILLLTLRSNLGPLIDGEAARDAFFAETVARQAAVLGAEHPRVFQTRLIWGVMTANLPRSAAMQQQACERAIQLHPQAADINRSCAPNVAFALEQLGEPARALEWMKRSESLSDASDDARAMLHAFVLLWSSDASRAAESFAAALEAKGLGPTSPWWDRYDAGQLHRGRAQALLTLGDRASAEAELKASIAEFEASQNEVTRRAFDARLDFARELLALSLAQHQPVPVEARELARLALPALRLHEVPAARLKALEEIAGQ